MSTRYPRIHKDRFGPWALVTGASSGIGLGFATQLAANGFHLAPAARRLSTLDNVGQDLASRYGISYRSIPVDLSDPDLLATIVDYTSDLDVGLVVSNADDMQLGPFLQASVDALRSELRLNAEAHLRLTHHFGQRLVCRAWPSASINCKPPSPRSTTRRSPRDRPTGRRSLPCKDCRNG